MNQHTDIEVVELGDAKDLTKGPLSPLATEESGAYPERKPGGPL